MEHVRLWRPLADQRIIAIHGLATSYRVDPGGEYVFGLIERRPLRVTRGRTRHLLRPGDLGVWDPSGTHTGSPLDTEPWECRLLIVEIPDLVDDADPLHELGPDLEFPEPVVQDPQLSRQFRALHLAMEHPASTLERQSRLASWLLDLVEHTPVGQRRRRLARHDPALSRAREFLHDNITTNVTLDDVAKAAGTNKFRLVRLFRERFGLPPHAFQIGQRVRLARRLLEQGISPANVAAQTGFHDQSHLNRHFTPTLGLTPGQYSRATLATPRAVTKTAEP